VTTVVIDTLQEALARPVHANREDVAIVEVLDPTPSTSSSTLNLAKMSLRVVRNHP
jgi:hypothetical protein